MDKHLNIIAFNTPYPPNYGGIIDIYYKIEALHALGVKTILHCFEYERPPAPELEALCETVFYYKRRTGIASNVTYLPYNVFSRKDPELLQNLLRNDYPILFEGLHSCYYMDDKRLKNRFKILRPTNIEHDYYRHLGKTIPWSVNKVFMLVEAARFFFYQKVIKHTDLVLPVSMTDTNYLQKQFPGKRIVFMSSFHPNSRMTIEPGISRFILYHAKLSVAENEHAALYLIKQVFSKLEHRCVIAGMNPSKRLLEAASPYKHISIEANPSSGRMNELIREAQVHLLITFQGTGLKLKLLNSLFAGRHIIVNAMMLAGSGLEPLCHIADTPDEMTATCNRLMNEPFTEAMIEQRSAYLIPEYTNEHQAKRLYQLIYDEVRPDL